jgi:carbon-monoxide dehydrogenase large subunit
VPLHGHRVEDARLLTGRGRFVADLIPLGALHGVFVRSDRAPARLVALDATAALSVPGVVAVITAQDLGHWGVPPLPQDPLPRDDGGAPFDRPVPLLCGDMVRHPGEPLALILAETLAAARDGAEAVAVTLSDADDPPVPVFVRSLGDADATAAALEGAAHVVTRRIVVPRVHALPLEPRGCLAQPGPDGRLHLVSSTQNPPALLKPLAQVLGVPVDRVRVSAGDVGGSFGLKGFLTREEALVALAALRLSRPVAWTATRSESLIADHLGRGVAGEVTLGFDADLRIVALSARMTLEAGAYASRRTLGIVNNAGGMAGVYAIPVAHLRLDGVTSPTPPVAPYRGHGRPEVTLALELTLDHAARALGVDPVELRRRNLLWPADLPRRTALGFTLDCGDFPAVLDRALALSAGAEGRAAEVAARGHLFGRGVIACVEAAGGPVRAPRPDHAVVTVAPDGTMTLAPGVMSVGQGHETVLGRLAAGRLGIDPARVRWHAGDTDAVPDGRGNGGSSGLAVCGPAVVAACDDALAQARALAAAAWGCAADAVAWRDGLLRRAGTNDTLTLAEVAALVGPVGITARGSFAPAAATFPNGAHVAEVEVDPETGVVTFTGYWAVEDVGTVMDPVLVDGQMQGGIAQGLSQVLGERVVTGAGGQVLTGSLMDYAVPRAGDLPEPRLGSHPVPTTVNPLGVKGVGEAGTVGALAAGFAAVCDALARAGAAEFDMPATPARVWAALQAVRGRG